MGKSWTLRAKGRRRLSSLPCFSRTRVRDAEGCDMNLPDESGRTPLSYTCEMGHLDAEKILVKSGADPEAADAWGNTALMYAAAAGQSALVEFLVWAFKRLSLQIDRQNKVCNSVVEVARYLRHKDCLQAQRSHSRRVHDDDEDALAEKLSTVNISEAKDEEKPLQIHAFEDGTRLPICLACKRSISLRKRIQSMDSIEECEREGDASSSQGRMLSGVFTPEPPQKHREHRCPNNHLPPVFNSPRGSTTPSSCAPASGPLGILFTPYTKSTKEELEKAKKLVFDAPVRRLDDCYYEKRCSLPTSTAPERLKLLHKSKAGFEHGSRSRSTLQLLRRFTFPELNRSSREAPEAPGRCIPRSETFPWETNTLGSGASRAATASVRSRVSFSLKLLLMSEERGETEPSVRSTNLLTRSTNQLTSAVPTNSIRARNQSLM